MMASEAILNRDYDFVVIGCGGIGSGALYWLSKLSGGDRVLGLEQFTLTHLRGGSQDYSRIVRRLYNLDVYAELAEGAYKCWRDVEKDSGYQLLWECGGLVLGKRGDKFVSGHLETLSRKGIPFEHLTGSEICQRYPQFNVDDTFEAVLDPRAGFVDAAKAIAVHVALARQRGATVLENCKVVKVSKHSDGRYFVHSSCGDFTAKKVILACGAWTNQTLGSFGVHLPLAVTQEQVSYYASPHIKDFSPDRFPIWIWSHDRLNLYGLPVHGIMGVKAGLDCYGPEVTAESRSFQPDPENQDQVDSFMKQFLPKGFGPNMLTKTCLYTMPPDRHFVVDTLESYHHPNVILCVGGGHAFKFASVLGKILAELATKGCTNHHIDEFSLSRPALTNPSFQPFFRNMASPNARYAGHNGNTRSKL